MKKAVACLASMISCWQLGACGPRAVQDTVVAEGIVDVEIGGGTFVMGIWQSILFENPGAPSAELPTAIAIHNVGVLGVLA